MEYKGLVKAVHLKVTTDYLLVNNGGHVTMSTRGLIGGDGGEIGASGGSYGGFGGNRNSCKYYRGYRMHLTQTLSESFPNHTRVANI